MYEYEHGGGGEYRLGSTGREEGEHPESGGT
jgi:hypothetical protein